MPAAAQQSCESLASLKIPNVTLTLAKSIEPPPDFVATRTTPLISLADIRTGEANE